MKQLDRLVALAAVAICSMLVPTANAQEPVAVRDAPRLPLTNSTSYEVKPLTYAQQRARFVDQQRVMQMAFNRWIGYSPLRPNMNASYMSNGVQRYYIPSRGMIVSPSNVRTWYW